MPSRRHRICDRVVVCHRIESSFAIASSCDCIVIYAIASICHMPSRRHLICDRVVICHRIVICNRICITFACQSNRTADDNHQLYQLFVSHRDRSLCIRSPDDRHGHTKSPTHKIGQRRPYRIGPARVVVTNRPMARRRPPLAIRMRPHDDDHHDDQSIRM